MPKLRLGGLLLDRRTALRLDCRRAAEQVGINHSTYWRAEQQGRLPDARIVVALCRWLGVSVEYALGLKEPFLTCDECARLKTKLEIARQALADPPHVDA